MVVMDGEVENVNISEDNEEDDDEDEEEEEEDYQEDYEDGEDDREPNRVLTQGHESNNSNIIVMMIVMKLFPLMG